MTPEEKVKRYDEVSKEIKEFFEGSREMYNDVTQTLEHLFPEFKESSDKRIRKEIISFLDDIFHLGKSANFDRWTTADCADWIVWLEKQGKQKSAKSIIETWKDMRLEVYQEASGNRHEPNYSDDTTKMFSLNDIDEIIEKISEQNPDDKVEPKFKVGDWVAINPELRFTSPLCIKDIDNNNYRVESLNGDSGVPRIKYLDNHYHHWSLKDAKDGDALASDGDALASDKSIFIFQGEYIAGKPSAYCGIVNGYFIKDEEGACWTNEKCYPATKEQRDILFQKMKEVGYEWDSKKKKLIKI